MFVHVGLVEVYKCELLASTCGQCLTLATDYSCVWCDDQCRNEASCQLPAEVLTHDDVCPDPQILSVSVVCERSVMLNCQLSLVVLSTSVNRCRKRLMSLKVWCAWTPFCIQHSLMLRLGQHEQNRCLAFEGNLMLVFFC